ncbi:MAG: MFS transporter [Solirubrobacteraceae bacterium]
MSSPTMEKTYARRLAVVVGAVVFVDTLFYAAVVPLLPTLAHQLHLSKFSAGVLTASYAVGTFIGSLPGGWLTVRIGPQRTVYVGLSLLAVSTLAFGWLHDVVALDTARLIEGIGGACTWAGGLVWVTAGVPPEQRGGAMGGALGAAIAGSLFGPIIGTIASGIGRGLAFSGVVVLAVLLIDQARRLPDVHTPSTQRLRDIGPALAGTGAGMACWLVALPAIDSGVLGVLGSLRLHRLGATATAIGGTFLISAGVEALLTPVVGRLSDRRGRLAPLRFGLAGTAAALACFTLPDTAAGLAVLIVMTGAIVAAFWAPAMAMLSETAESGGLEQGYAAALMNMAWALGQMAGAGVGGAMAKAAGDVVPMMAAAGLAIVTLAMLTRRRARGLAYARGPGA